MDKKEQLITTAFQLFYRHGVHAVGINRVLAESGVAKKTLYNHFPGKDDLVAATIDHCDRRYFSWLNGRLENVEDGEEALWAVFDALDDLFKGRDPSVQAFYGCYFINVAAEFSDPNDPIHQKCARNKMEMMKLIRFHVAQMLPYEESKLEISDTIAMLIEGAIVRAHVASDADAALKAKAAAKRLFSTQVEV